MSSISIRSFTVGELRKDPSALIALDDPHGYMKFNGPDYTALLTNNPNGIDDDLAMVLAMDGDSVVGRLGFVAAQLRIAGTLHRTYWTAGFFLAPEYKASGAGAMILLRGISACGSIVAAGGPDEDAQKLYLASGFRKIAVMQRYLYFYRAKMITGKLFGAGPVANFLGVIAQPLIRLFYAFKSASSNTLTFERVEQISPELDPILASEARNMMARDVATLNWILRHRQVLAYEIYENKILRGFLFLKQYDHLGGGRRAMPPAKIGCILDFYMINMSKSDRQSLVDFAIATFKRCGVDLFEFNVNDAELADACKRRGMIPVEGTLAFVRPPRGVKLEAKDCWFLTPGAGDLIMAMP